jgi:ppGpp synthetase/RelA/SpoT-type nucleotidyltranferase
MQKQTSILSKREYNEIDGLVRRYVDNQEYFKRFCLQVQALFFNSDALAPHVHSMKWRIKDARDKLVRKASAAKRSKKTFGINKDNLFETITDLVGFRILHLYTKQIELINKVILQLLREEKWHLIEGPIARTWDDESRQYFQEMGIATQDSASMYTSVHYVFKANKLTKWACELQVRTLAEELWGEVDHRINYPHETPNSSCREQIKVLARVTSSCSRLVDSIFHSHTIH